MQASRTERTQWLSSDTTELGTQYWSNSTISVHASWGNIVHAVKSSRLTTSDALYSSRDLESLGGGVSVEALTANFQ